MYLRSQFNGDTTTNMSKCTLTTCGGHALHETSGWYSDEPFFVYVANGSPHYWFRRGDYYSGTYNNDDTGVFSSRSDSGRAHELFSWRSVLVVDEV